MVILVQSKILATVQHLLEIYAMAGVCIKDKQTTKVAGICDHLYVVNGCGHLYVVNGCGHLYVVNGCGHLYVVNGCGHLYVVNGCGHLNVVNGCGHLYVVNGCGHLYVVNGCGVRGSTLKQYLRLWYSNLSAKLNPSPPSTSCSGQNSCRPQLNFLGYQM
jgi:hypothetical protein